MSDNLEKMLGDLKPFVPLLMELERRIISAVLFSIIVATAEWDADSSSGEAAWNACDFADDLIAQMNARSTIFGDRKDRN